jgi:hypothetical protein
VDADARSIDDIARLKTKDVEVLPFAEIENLFLIEPVIRFAAKILSLDEETTVANVKQSVLERFGKEQEAVVSSLTANELEGAFREFDARAIGKTALTTEFDAVVKKVNAGKAYERWNAEIEHVIASGDYTAALRFYSNKGLTAALGGIFKTPLRELILRKLRSADAGQILPAMQGAVPQLK